MLRVRLDCCDVRDGVVHFDGAPLSGIGVEVGSESVVRGVPAGVVSLWKYDKGRREGAWIEPWFEAEPGRILDTFGKFDATDGTPARIFESARFDGLLARFGGCFLEELELCIDGEQMHKSIEWRHDGSLLALGDYEEVTTRAGTFRVRVSAAWGSSEWHRPTSLPATTIGCGLTRGNIRAVPRLEPQFPGDVAGPPKFWASGDHTSGYKLGLDETDRINFIRMADPSHFEMLSKAGIRPKPLSWLLESFEDFGRFEIGSALSLHLSAECADLIISALGGFGAFSSMERLAVSTYHLRPEQVGALLESPALYDVEVTEQEHARQRERNVRKLCQAFLERRPGARVIFDNNPL